MAFLDENGLAELWACVSEKYQPKIDARAKIVVGYYSGFSGTFTVDFEPKFMMVKKTTLSASQWIAGLAQISGWATNVSWRAPVTVTNNGNGTYTLTIGTVTGTNHNDYISGTNHYAIIGFG